MKYLALLLLFVSCSNPNDVSPKFKVGDQILVYFVTSSFNEVNCQERYVDIVKISKPSYLVRYKNTYSEIQFRHQKSYVKVNCPKY